MSTPSRRLLAVALLVALFPLSLVLLTLRAVYNSVIAPFLLDPFVWSSIAKRSQGNDLLGLELRAVLRTPFFEGVCSPELDAEVETSLASLANQSASAAVPKLRMIIGQLAVDRSAASSVLTWTGEALTGKELIHTSYFEVPEFLDAVCAHILKHASTRPTPTLASVRPPHSPTRPVVVIRKTWSREVVPELVILLAVFGLIASSYAIASVLHERIIRPYSDEYQVEQALRDASFAKAAATSSDSDSYRRRVLNDWFDTLVMTSRFPEALDVATEYDELARADHLVRVGQATRGIDPSVFARVLEELRQITRTYDGRETDFLVRVSESLSALGDGRAANFALARALMFANAGKEDSYGPSALVTVAGSMVKRGNRNGAIRLVSEAVDLAGKSEGLGTDDMYNSPARCFLDAAQVLEQLGETARATEVVKLAQQAVEKRLRPHPRRIGWEADLPLKVAGRLVTLGLGEEALRFAKQAKLPASQLVELARSSEKVAARKLTLQFLDAARSALGDRHEPPNERLRYQAVIAVELWKAGKRSDAETLLRRIPLEGDYVRRSYALQTLALAWLEVGVFPEAYAAAGRIEHAYVFVETHGHMGALLVERGSDDQARLCFNRAVEQMRLWKENWPGLDQELRLLCSNLTIGRRYAEAKDVARRIQDRVQRINVLAAILEDQLADDAESDVDAAIEECQRELEGVYRLDDQSKLSSRISRLLAARGHLRRARLICAVCSPLDKLNAYATLLAKSYGVEHLISRPWRKPLWFTEDDTTIGDATRADVGKS